ncbi:MAG: hypothetical protein ACREWI_03490 [Telluria sp.]
MATSLSKHLAACAFALAAAGICTQASAAPETNHPKAEAVLKARAKAKAKPKAVSKKAKAAAAAAAAAAVPAASAEDVAEPDITNMVATEYACELGNKITIHTHETDASHIALRWKKRLHRLKRVVTTTGAHRFENPHWGLVWIGIPAKGILLDSRQNRQLANECKSAEQAAPIIAAVDAEKKS